MYEQSPSDTEQRTAADVRGIVYAKVNSSVAKKQCPKREYPPSMPGDRAEEGNEQYHNAEAVRCMGGGEAELSAAVFASVGVHVHVNAILYFGFVGRTGTLDGILDSNGGSVGAEHGKAEAEQYAPSFFAIVPKQEKKHDSQHRNPAFQTGHGIHYSV